MSFQAFHTELSAQMDASRLLSSSVDLLAHGTDASMYRLIPKLVVKAEDEADVIRIIRLANQQNVPITFRTAGTSLSGQAVTDSVLVKLGHDWKGFSVEENGTLIRLQPGVIGAHANRILAPYGRKIGPDPASIDSAMIGGIAANNASGMCCGTAQNSYRTMQSLKLVFADGTRLDSADPDSVSEFRETKSALLDQLSSIRQEILADPKLLAMVRRKYKIKNTTGYSINSFVDFEDPLDILLHLMIGSEGTLAFISEITYRTVEDLPRKAAALVLFPNIRSGCRATIDLKSAPVSAVELMDDVALRSMAGKAGVPAHLDDGTMGLLIDVRGKDDSELEQKKQGVQELLGKYGVDVQFSSDRNRYAELWKIRKGLFPIVGANRDKGTTVIIEDVCFPIETLSDATARLRQLLDEYDYSEAVIFGHALEGNLHFVFTQSFDTQDEVRRYADFMDALSKFVAGEFGGSLKAEHGTGRNMAPFVEFEWGEKAYKLMCQIKKLFDPTNILNPDVVISKNASIHISDLKPIPAADDIVDDCIECGFCESVCPSRDLTLSPRQRIAVWREIQRRRSAGESLSQWEKDFGYQGDETCATDGICATRCPVNIDTGKLIKKLRSENHGAVANTAANLTSKYFGATSSLARGGLKLAGLSRKFLGKRSFNDYPSASKAVSFSSASSGKEQVVYLSSCVVRTMSSEQRDLRETILSLLEKIDVQPIIPPHLDSLCCGMPYSSKGFTNAATQMSASVGQQLRDASDNGRIPIICDNSPCSYHMVETLEKFGLTVLDAPSFFASRLERLEIEKKPEAVMVFPVCSITKAGDVSDLTAIANACSQRVSTPEQIACCGFAGDRGFSHPELNASALNGFREQCDGHQRGVSSSRTCEIGFTRHSELTFDSILRLLDECSERRE